MVNELFSGPARASQVTVSSTVPTTIYAGTTKLGIQIKALAANTGIIYIGGSDVTSSKGYPLAAGESLFLPVDAVDAWKALASINNDKINILVF